MRLDELRAREDIDGIVVRTLERAWSLEFGRSFRVEPGGAGEQRWRVQPLLSGYFVEGASSAPRRFLRDQFRHTPVWRRRLPQYLLGTALASRVGLRLTGPVAFSVTPAIPGAEERLVVPGNRRLRTFDFASGRSRVVLKDGFSRAAIEREVAVRGGGAQGPFIPITRSDVAEGWFEEPIFDGYAMPRCPPWFRQRALGQRALELLEAWSGQATREVDARSYAEGLAERIRGALLEDERAPKDNVKEKTLRRLDELVARANGTALLTSRSHGDFQPGNVLVSRDGGRVLLTDWEYSGERSVDYDRLVWALGSRTGRDLDGALRALERGRGRGAAAPVAARADRGTRVAVFELEEMSWRAVNSEPNLSKTPR